MNLEVVFDSLMVEALGDHDNTSLDIEAQSHLSTALVVLFPNRHKDLVLQEWGTCYIHPRRVTETKIETLILLSHFYIQNIFQHVSENLFTRMHLSRSQSDSSQQLQCHSDGSIPAVWAG